MKLPSVLCAFTITLQFFSTGVHAGKVDPEDVFATYNITAVEVAKLETGEVVNLDASKYEGSVRELAADAAVLIKRPFPDVTDLVEDNISILPQRKILSSAVITSDADFAALKYGNSDRDYQEVQRLLKAKPGSDYNFTDEEYASLKEKFKDAAALNREQRIDLASEALREVLINRHKMYLEKGLDGIPSSIRKSQKSVDHRQDLIGTVETNEPASPWFPEYYKVLRNFPDGSECCQHKFTWLKIKLAKRATFVLSHQIVQNTDDFLLVTERYYYLNHSGNYGQVVLLWLPYQNDTYMSIALSANTEVLESLLGRVFRPIGRKEADKMIIEVLETIKTDLEAGRQPAGELRQ